MNNPHPCCRRRRRRYSGNKVTVRYIWYGNRIVPMQMMKMFLLAPPTPFSTVKNSILPIVPIFHLSFVTFSPPTVSTPSKVSYPNPVHFSQHFLVYALQYRLVYGCYASNVKPNVWNTLLSRRSTLVSACECSPVSFAGCDDDMHLTAWCPHSVHFEARQKCASIPLAQYFHVITGKLIILINR